MDKLKLSDKYLLTIKESMLYFNIGRHSLEDIIRSPECDFVNYIGRKAMINRKKFEEYLLSNRYI